MNHHTEYAFTFNWSNRKAKISDSFINREFNAAEPECPDDTSTFKYRGSLPFNTPLNHFCRYQNL